jgi:hypothetical protein
MSFWEDLSPGIKIAVVVGVIGLLYFIVARFAGLPPYACQDGAHYEGMIFGECVVDAQQRGFDQNNATGAEAEE